MKNTILTTALLVATLTLHAQENVTQFQVEQQNYLLLEGYAPNAIIECYSTPEGGNQMDKIKLNKEGAALQTYDAAHSPAFVLNRKTPANVSGTNKVIHLERKEFVAKNIVMDVIAQEVKLSWDAQIPCGSQIEFQILKKEAGSDYKAVKIFTGSNGTGFNKYNFSEAYQTNTTYTMQIVKDGKKIRYATGPIGSASSPDWVRVYPTICSDQLFIDLQGMNVSADYAVTDMSGKLLQKSKLNEQYNKIDVSRLSAGNYLISIIQGSEQKSFKITKN